MFVYLAVSETQCIIYRPDFENSQVSRKKLKKQLMVKAKLSINVKTKNTSKHDYCWSFLTYLKYRVSHSGRERAGLGLWRGEWVPHLCSPILLISPCNGLQPPMGATPYILKYALHTTLVNPPISGFPLHTHSMQRGELHQIFAVFPPPSPHPLPETNSLQFYTKPLENCVSFNMPHQSYSCHSSFALWQCFIITHRSENFQ